MKLNQEWHMNCKALAPVVSPLIWCPCTSLLTWRSSTFPPLLGMLILLHIYPPFPHCQKPKILVSLSGSEHLGSGHFQPLQDFDELATYQCFLFIDRYIHPVSLIGGILGLFAIFVLSLWLSNTINSNHW